MTASHRTLNPGVLYCAAAATIAALLAVTARAESTQFGYEMAISGSKSLLQSGNSVLASNYLLGDAVNMRNNPWISLTNTSDDATLDRFVITVGDTDYKYSKATLSTKSGTFECDVQLIDGGQKLELVFDDFNPGETVFVKFQLRPVDPDDYQYPDFRTVLFKANGADDSENAEVTADFYDSTTDQSDPLTGRLPNYDVLSADAPMSTCARCMCVPMTSGIFQSFSFEQSDLVDPPDFPEPSSLVLALLGGAAALLFCRKRT